jgi:hypothetical protein
MSSFVAMSVLLPTGTSLESYSLNYVLEKRYDLTSMDDFTVESFSDAHLTGSCANYVDDGSTAFSDDGELVLKVSSACEDGLCLQSGRVMSNHASAHGVYIIEATVPKCGEIWPAIWLHPTNDRYGSWPCTGEIDIMETTGALPHATFNLVTGSGGSNPEAPECNACQGGYSLSSTIEDWAASRYFVEDVNCSEDHKGSWSRHTFVLHWRPTRITTLVDPVIRYDEAGHLRGILPTHDVEPKDWWDRDVATFKVREYNETDQWSRASAYMDTCYPEAPVGAPFDDEMRLVMNIAVGGYGGAENCFWGSESCGAHPVCQAAIGAEMRVHGISFFKPFESPEVPAAPGAWAPCSAGDAACCNPHLQETQICPSGDVCQECGGGDACRCPPSTAPDALFV